MASTERIKVFFDGDSKGVEGAAKRSSKAVNNFGGAAQKMGGILAGAFAGTAIIRGMGQAITKIAEFESTMRRVALISKGSEKELSNLAKTLGGTTVFTANQAGEAMTFLAQAGFKSNEIMKATPGVLELAAATMIDLASAADIASNILSGYGLKASKINMVNDLLVTTTNNSNTSVLQFAEAFKTVGPIAKGAGISINEVASLIGVLGDAGIQGSLAGTQLKTAISQLINPSGAAAATLKELGVQTKDANGELRPLTDIFDDLGKAGMTAEQSFAIFEQRAASGALVMAGSAAKARELAEQTKEVGVASAQSTKQLDTLKGDIALLSSAWEALVLEGSAFNTALRESIQGLTTFITIISGGKGVTPSIAELTKKIKDLKAEAETKEGVIAQVFGTGQSLTLINREIKSLTTQLDALKGLEAAKLIGEDPEKTRTIIEKMNAILAAQKAEAMAAAIAMAAYNDTVERTGKGSSKATSGMPTFSEFDPVADQAANLQSMRENIAAFTEYAAQQEEQRAGYEIAIAQETKKKRLAIAASVASGLATMVSSISAMQNMAMNSEIAAAGDNEEKKLAIRKEYAEKQKKISIAQALIGVAQSIIMAMSTLPPPASFIMAGITAAAGAIQVGAIASQKFARGTSFAPGGMALVGERGPEMVNLPKGSSVTPNHLMGGGQGGGDIVLKLNEYEFARVVNIATQNQGTNVARTTF